MSEDVLIGVTLGVPLLALAIDFLSSVGISERHHSHHDTYLVTSSFSGALVVAMVFMGVTGLLLYWLCWLGVFVANRLVILAFFSAFLAVLFIIWMCIRRYRVATYESCMIVTPLLGPSTTIRYRDIEKMEWSGIRAGTGYRNLIVYAKGKRCARLWGVLDMEQILMSIDRYDVLLNN